MQLGSVTWKCTIAGGDLRSRDQQLRISPLSSMTDSHVQLYMGPIR